MSFKVEFDDIAIKEGIAAFNYDLDIEKAVYVAVRRVEELYANEIEECRVNNYDRPEYIFKLKSAFKESVKNVEFIVSRKCREIAQEMELRGMSPSERKRRALAKLDPYLAAELERSEYADDMDDEFYKPKERKKEKSHMDMWGDLSGVKAKESKEKSKPASETKASAPTSSKPTVKKVLTESEMFWDELNNPNEDEE